MKFVTLTNHRSGSSFFQRCLNSHPDIAATQEILRRQKDETGGQKILIDFYNSEDKHGILGFKCMYTHLEDWTIPWFKDNDVKILQLIRCDVLNTAIWYKKHVEGDVKGGLGPPLVVNGEVKAKIPTIIETVEMISKNILKYREVADYTVFYEDLTNNQDVREFYDKKVRKDMLEDFFGVKDVALQDNETYQAKNIRPENKECIINYRELLDAVASAGLSTYLGIKR